MERVGVRAGEQDDLVEPVMAKAGMGDGAEGVGLGERRGERDRLGLGGLAQPPLGQRLAAFRLAEHAEPKRHRGADLPGQLEQGARLARDQLELDLAERRLGLAADDDAFVEHDLDPAALVRRSARTMRRKRERIAGGERLGLDRAEQAS